jgi:3-hydroxyacyl-CoA dehydrogenase/enoyl-CoA hydratase/3-hydroxybutyryl-CoA epimerase
MSAAFTLARDGDLLVLRFDLPGEKVNLLRRETMDELEQRLAEARAMTGVRALLIESGKATTFIAGADVNAIAGLTDAATGEAAALRGQEIFARLEALPFPTVALIHGACVGGGLELALACTHRVASNDVATKLGLPEVLLGILPGFGGTQRLPRTIGLVAALPLLLTGRLLSARASRRIGLVDAVAPKEALRDAARRVVAAGRRRRPPAFGARLLERAIRTVAPLRRRILAKAADEVRRKAGDLFPAPPRILAAVAAGYDRSRDEGFRFEAQELGRLASGPVSRSLVRLYLLSEKAKAGGEDAAGALTRTFVAGAGQMGAAIAAQFAGAGLRVRMHDPMPEALARGRKRAAESLARRFRDDPARAQAAVDRLEASAERTGLGHCDLVLEAAVEDLAVKRALFSELEAKVRSDAVLATNTSSLDVDAISQGLARRERFVGLHFFHPVESMRLVEVVRGAATDERTVAVACALARRVGKTPVVVANRPGFLVNRVLAPYLLEAERLVDEGAPPAVLDRATRAAGMAMGPVELLDEVGLDVAARAGDVMRAAFPERFADVGLVRRLAGEKRLGKKSGRGFYVHSRSGGERVPDPALPTRAPLGSLSADPESVAQWVDRLVHLLVAESWRCLEERVAASADDVDLALQLGAGVLIAHGGPLTWARARGLAAVVARLDELARAHGARFAPPEQLRRESLSSPSPSA